MAYGARFKENRASLLNSTLHVMLALELMIFQVISQKKNV